MKLEFQINKMENNYKLKAYQDVLENQIIELKKQTNILIINFLEATKYIIKWVDANKEILENYNK